MILKGSKTRYILIMTQIVLLVTTGIMIVDPSASTTTTTSPSSSAPSTHYTGDTWAYAGILENGVTYHRNIQPELWIYYWLDTWVLNVEPNAYQLTVTMECVDADYSLDVISPTYEQTSSSTPGGEMVLITNPEQGEWLVEVDIGNQEGFYNITAIIEYLLIDWIQIGIGVSVGLVGVVIAGVLLWKRRRTA